VGSLNVLMIREERKFVMRLEGKASLVTGAGRGIGRAVALEFAREGARVIVAEMDELWGAKISSGSSPVKLPFTRTRGADLCGAS